MWIDPCQVKFRIELSERERLKDWEKSRAPIFIKLVEDIANVVSQLPLHNCRLLPGFFKVDNFRGGVDLLN